MYVLGIAGKLGKYERRDDQVGPRQLRKSPQRFDVAILRSQLAERFAGALGVLHDAARRLHQRLGERRYIGKADLNLHPQFLGKRRDGFAHARTIQINQYDAIELAGQFLQGDLPALAGAQDQCGSRLTNESRRAENAAAAVLKMRPPIVFILELGRGRCSGPRCGRSRLDS